MMVEISVDGLLFTFPDSINPIPQNYDKWAFYKNQFCKIQNGIKAVDLIAIENSAIENSVIWFIEVKDYRQHSRTKVIDLADEVAQKVLYTLAAMLPAKTNASDLSERDFAKKVLKGQRLRVVLHLEQPRTHPIDLSNIKIKLKSRLKCIDPHPMVVESTQMRGLPWTVTNS